MRSFTYSFQILLLFLFAGISMLRAQQNAGINTSTPDPSAALDIVANDKGLLVPRMSTSERLSITDPATSLLVYDLDLGAFYFFDGSQWLDLLKTTSALSRILDTDGDTWVDVEKNPDEDTIRFTVNGFEVAKLDDKTLHLGSPGKSVLIGTNAGTHEGAGAENNVAIGPHAMFSNDNRSHLVAIGDSSLASNGMGVVEVYEGTQNTAIGSRALQANTLGYSNTGIGYKAMQNNIDGGLNTALGAHALNHNSSGFVNTAVGQAAMYYNTTGEMNTAIGRWAMHDNLYGDHNTAVGAYALKSDTTGSLNVAVGKSALFFNKNRSQMVAVGDSALFNNSRDVIPEEFYKAIANTAVGSNALFSNTSGHENTALGARAGYSNISGILNVAVGAHALWDNKYGHRNTAIGTNALYGADEYANDNTGLGFKALFSNEEGDYNVSIGSKSAYSNLNGNSNILIGYEADYFNGNGDENTIIGHQAGKGSGTHNKNGSVFLGYQAGMNETTSNKLYIENSDSADPLIYGDFSSDIVGINGKLGVGLEDPLSKLAVGGQGNTDWTVAAYNGEHSGRAVYGSATNSAYGTFNYGGYFESAGDNGAGVYGLATTTTESFASGGYFESYGDYGHGVVGASNGPGGVGVYGTSYYFGDGISNGGFFYAQSSESRGVFASSSGTSGIGVKGTASSTGDGINYGGHFTASASGGIGVYGYANQLGTGQNIGGKFTSLGSNGIGILGTVSGFTGIAVKGIASNPGLGMINYGGYFESGGGQGIGVYANAAYSGSSTNYGGKFFAHGSSGRGIYGEATGENGIAIQGIASNGSSTNYGGKFQANGNTGFGVYAEATGDGGIGLFGTGSGYDGRGVQAEASGTESKALFAAATSPSGENYAVYGYTNSPDGYGGFFVGKGHFSGDVGIGPGALYPDAKLEIDGQIKITGGIPGEGKVLTSDADGLASWQSNQNHSALGTTMATAYMDMNDMFKPHVNNCNGSSERFIELFIGAGVGFCIEIDERPAEFWNDAQATCLQNGKRLPEPWEWQTACDRNELLNLGLKDLDNGWEWSSNFPTIQDSEGSSSYRSISVPVFGDGDCGTCQWLHVATSNALRSEQSYRCVR